MFFEKQRNCPIIMAQHNAGGLFSLLIICLWLLSPACSKSTSGPEPGPDTTSHNFVWQIDTLGTHSSVLYDVAIAGEEIWAVGEIHTAETDTFDSLGNWVPPYNIVHWNGNEWKLKRVRSVREILYPGSIGPDSVYVKGYSIYIIDEQNIWIASGNVHYFNGTNWIQMKGEGAGFANEIWGSSSENLYFVGDNGNIVHYNGNEWQKLESGTTLPIQDVRGAVNPNTRRFEILCTASEKYQISEKKILYINSETRQISFVEWPFQERRIHSVWFDNDEKLWVCGAGVFLRENRTWQEFSELPLIFTNRIRGVESNDIFIAGDFGFVGHYNGISWKVYPEVNGPLYESLDYKTNLMVAVGHRHDRGFILRMWRNNL